MILAVSGANQLCDVIRTLLGVESPFPETLSSRLSRAACSR